MIDVETGAFVRTVLGFSVARFALGLGEAGNFPAAIKTVAEWFPKKERALATGIFNSGTNIGVIVAALMVPPIFGVPAKSTTACVQCTVPRTDWSGVP